METATMAPSSAKDEMASNIRDPLPQAPREPAIGLGVPVAGVVHLDHAEHVI